MPTKTAIIADANFLYQVPVDSFIDKSQVDMFEIKDLVDSGVMFNALPATDYDTIIIDIRSLGIAKWIFSELLRRLKVTGKVIVHSPDFLVTACDIVNSGSVDDQPIDLVRDTEFTIPNICKALEDGGFRGPMFENRVHARSAEAKPGVAITKYAQPIMWTVLSEEVPYDEIRGKNCVITTPGDEYRPYESMLNDWADYAEEDMFRTTLCMSTLTSPSEADVLQLSMARAAREEYDEYIFLCDNTSLFAYNMMMSYRKGIIESGRHCTLIFSADLSGIVTAWNRMFFMARGKYVFLNSSDFMTHHPFKDPIIEHFEADPSIGWILGQNAGRLGSAFAYASGIRRSALMQVKGLSPEFNPCTADDNDLGVKLRLAGYKVISCMHTEVSHLAKHGGGTCDAHHGIFNDRNFMSWRQLSRYYRKYADNMKLAEECANLCAVPNCGVYNEH